MQSMRPLRIISDMAGSFGPCEDDLVTQKSVASLTLVLGGLCNNTATFRLQLNGSPGTVFGSKEIRGCRGNGRLRLIADLDVPLRVCPIGGQRPTMLKRAPMAALDAKRAFATQVTIY